MEEIKQVLGFDASKAIAELTKLDGTLLQFENALRSTGATFTVFNKNAGKTVSAFIQLTKHGASAASALGKVTASQNNPTANLNAASTAAAQLAVSLKQAGVTGQSASVKIGGALVRLGKQSNSAATQVVADSQRMTTSLALLSRIVFTQFIVRALSQLRRAFESTTQGAAEFQQQIALIQTISSGSSFGKLSDDVIALSDALNIPRLEAAAGVYQSLSNQVGSTAESLEFSAKAGQFARATNSSLADSVDLLSGAIKGFGKEFSETDHVASVFFKTVDLGRIEASELANSFGRVNATSKELGLTIEETNGALAAMTIIGTGTSEAITQLRAIESALLKPSEALKKALADLGFSSGQMATKTLGLVGTLRALKTSTNGSASELAKLFPNVRALAGVTSVAGDDFKTLNDNIKELQSVPDNFAASKALIVMGTDAEKVTSSINKLSNSIVTNLGNSLLTSTGQLIDMGGGVESLTDVIKVASPAIVGLGVSIAAVGTSMTTANLAGIKLGRTLGALALVPAAIGAGEAIGNALNERISESRNENLNFLEASNAKELQAFSATQNQKIAAADAANRKIVESTLRAAQAINRVASPDQIANALNGDRGVTALEGLAGGRQIQTMEQLAAATESAANKASELRKQIAAAALESEKLRTVSAEVNTALGSVSGTGNGTTGEFADGLRAQLASLKADLTTLASSSNITEQQLTEVIAKRNEFGKAALEGENPLVGKLGFAADINQLDIALTKLQQLKQIQAQSTPDPGLQASLTKLEQVLALNPAAQFGGATQAMNGAVGPANAIADAWERAAVAAERAARAAASSGPVANQAFGGMMHLAGGGFAPRGVDTIPAMLSPGEFVMNAKSSRNFYSQLQAMNAGQTPAYRESGGSVTTVGDTNVNINVAGGPTPLETARETMKQLNRVSRQGTGRLRQ